MDKLEELISTTEILQTKVKAHIKEGQGLQKELREHLRELLKWVSQK